jgi:hypothetical protein
MRRWLAVAALGAAFLTLPAWGQRRGGASGGFAGRAGFAARGPSMSGRGPMMMNRSPGFAGVQRGGVHFVMGGFGHPVSSPFFFHHHSRFFRSWPYTGYYGYPYYSYPWDYGDNSYSADSYQNYAASDYSTAYADNNRQQAEIDRLENEVDRLSGERETRESRASSTAQPSPKAELPPTQLVFRDKHTEAVRNYAIVGQTFWILNAERARKIPLAELDIAATKKANDDRGVEFQLPE